MGFLLVVPPFCFIPVPAYRENASHSGGTRRSILPSFLSNLGKRSQRGIINHHTTNAVPKPLRSLGGRGPPFREEDGALTC